MVQLSATKYSYIAILCVSLVSFAAITLCVASQRVTPKVSVYFVIDSVRKVLDIPSYNIFVLYILSCRCFVLFKNACNSAGSVTF
jgi:predicted transcriptional regulator